MTDAEKLRSIAQRESNAGFELGAEFLTGLATKLERLHDRGWRGQVIRKKYGLSSEQHSSVMDKVDAILEALEQPCSIFPQND